MIWVRREKVAAPAVLESDLAQDARREARRFFQESLEWKSQQKFKFDKTIFAHLEVRHALSELFRDKCAFCETQIVAGSEEVLHFRPTQRTVDLRGHLFPKHYWWLAYEWRNLYLACRICNVMKGSRFPVSGPRAPEAGQTDAEELLLLDPCDRHDEELVFDKSGQVASTTERGQTTIQVFNLNRRGLVNARISETQKLYAMLDMYLSSYRSKTPEPKIVKETVTSIAGLVDEGSPFAAMKRQFLRMWFRAHEDTPCVRAVEQGIREVMAGWLPIQAQAVTPSGVRQIHKSFLEFRRSQEKYSLRDKAGGPQYFAQTRLIERIVVHNFRVIHHLELMCPEVQSDRAPWTVLLGENGTGKSSVLQAVALTLVGTEYRSSLQIRPLDVLRHGCRSGYVKVYLTGRTDPVVLTFSERESSFEGDPPEPKVLLLGYGATRLLPTKVTVEGGKKYANIDNLLDPFTPLRNPEPWLLSLPDDVFESVNVILTELLCLDKGEKLLRSKGKKPCVRIRTFGYRLSLRELSDGYQSVIALAADIMSVMHTRWKAIDIAEGIVLLDEIGAHLHPRWKMRVVGTLRAAFPRIQFISTTHNPLCLRGLIKGEVISLRRGPHGRIAAIADLPEAVGLQVDQLLTSEYFGLHNTIDPEVESFFEEYYDILRSTPLNADQEARLSELKAMLEKHDLMGSTRRERLMLEAADEWLAQERDLVIPTEREALKEETRRRIVEMWKALSERGEASE